MLKILQSTVAELDENQHNMSVVYQSTKILWLLTYLLILQEQFAF